MNPYVEINRLKDIQTVCGALRMRIELDVARLNAEIDHLAQVLDSTHADLKALDDSWRKAVTGASLQLAAAAFWSVEIVRKRTQIAQIEERIRRAQAARQNLFDNLKSISARDDAVGALKARAVRLAVRRHEEAVLENHALRPTAGWGDICG